MNLLIYYPYNSRSVVIESEIEKFIEYGNKITFLTSCRRGVLHRNIEDLGADTYEVKTEYTKKLLFYITNIYLLAKLVYIKNINVVIAHQQVPALISGFLKLFMLFKLIYVRHNSDEDYLNFPKKARFLNFLVNSLTPIKIAPSRIVQEFWINKEGVNKNIVRINYGYNFSRYEKPALDVSFSIRDKYDARFLILSISRNVSAKRHLLMFDVVEYLSKKGINVKMLCLGPDFNDKNLMSEIRLRNLTETVFLLGKKNNIMDYIHACDAFLHLSSSEASNSAVKEVGLGAKPVIVCKQVGDFEDYIEHGVNGFLVSKEDPVLEAITILESIALGSISGAIIGTELKEKIIDQFDVKNVIDKYQQLFSN